MRFGNSLFNTAVRKGVITVAFSLVGFLAPGLAAQQQSFQVVPDHSTARLFIGTSEAPKSFNVAVARVSGEASIDEDSLDASSFNFKIYAGNQEPAGDSDSQALAGDQPVLSFQSQHVTRRSDGTLQVDGQLTVTQAEREALANAGEDYSGPVYGPTRLVRATHAATFIFAPLSVESAPDSPGEPANVRLLEVQETQNQAGVLLAATTMVNGEAFPELASSIEKASWPAATSDVRCSMPGTVGEDYSGPQCSGNVIEPLASAYLPAQIGEDYSGTRIQPPQGNLVTIDLGLVLTSAEESNAGSHQNLPDDAGKGANELLQSAHQQ